MISYTQAMILGLLQGVTELFPISSLGHSVILPRLLGWNLRQQDPFFLIYLVATHLATALVLLGFFWRDWVKIVAGMGRSLAARRIEPGDTGARLGWLLVVGTVPAGLAGLILEKPLRQAFASPLIAAFFLILNGALLYTAERLRRNAPVSEADGDPDSRIARIPWTKAIGVGIAQTLALLPGFSRSGAVMSGGLRAGLSNDDAARFGFLLATPIIGAASLLKLPQLFHPANRPVLVPALMGGACAALAAYLSVRFLMRFFETHRLTPFAGYCGGAGILCSIYFLLH